MHLSGDIGNGFSKLIREANDLAPAVLTVKQRTFRN
jgi:hypothetical protein